MGTSLISLEAEDILKDYKLIYMSRQTSLLGRKEVLNGRAKFGIFGDGKELAQIALAKVFKKGDWRSGYYRDQTLMLALKQTSVKKFFAQLYAHTNIDAEPCSGGRQMNSHYATRFFTNEGLWTNQMDSFNSSADISPTGGQMARLLGLAYASKIYRENKDLHLLKNTTHFSQLGNEVAFGTIGNASTSEGLFWETLNASGVLQVPMVLSIWDDDYGISVPNKYQTTKENISLILAGFQSEAKSTGINLYCVDGFDYKKLMQTYQEAVKKCREEHTPCVIHVQKLSQPQGHSTSGSHERYKSKRRLDYENDIDCIKVMRQWILKENYASENELLELEESCTAEVNQNQKEAWAEYQEEIILEREETLKLLKKIQETHGHESVQNERQELEKLRTLYKKSIHQEIEKVLINLKNVESQEKSDLIQFFNEFKKKRAGEYHTHLHVESAAKHAPLATIALAPTYSTSSKTVDGRQVIQAYFDHLLSIDPRVFIIGEDIGKLGGVNLEFEDLQSKHGETRVTDTGIREATILGQGIGSALRGLRPIVDIQYLDYLLFCLQGLSDDLATLHYRTSGGQVAPVIIRTKGHRLEGIWHTGSPMGMILSSMRGIHVCVPRNCVQAIGMYQTLMNGDDPGLVIEVLNGYRMKEKMPDNIGGFAIPLGQCETICLGSDITIVTYGANIRVALEAMVILKEKFSIEAELIDVQTLLPFDKTHMISKSLSKTHAVLFLDEDVPGGASAYMMQEVLERQRGYEFLDAPPKTLTAKPHRSAYSSDGDFYCKPNEWDIVHIVYEMIHERFPKKFPLYDRS